MLTVTTVTVTTVTTVTVTTVTVTTVTVTTVTTVTQSAAGTSVVAQPVNSPGSPVWLQGGGFAAGLGRGAGARRATSDVEYH